MVGPRLLKDVAAAAAGVVVAVTILAGVGHLGQHMGLWGTSASLLDATDPGHLARYGGTLTAVRANEPLTLNPLLAADTASLFFVTRMFNNMFTNDFDVGTVPDLVETWTSNSAGTGWTFKLRRGVTWHDGQPFTAADVEFTYAQLRDPVVGAVHQAAHLFSTAGMEVKATDTHVVTIKLARAVPSLVTFLTVPIIPRHLYEGECLFKSDFNRRPVGTGPFAFDSWEQGRQITLSAHDDYFDGRPYLDRLVFLFEPDPYRRAELLVSGEAQAGWVAAPLYHDMVKSDQLEVYRFESFVVDLIGFNLEAAPLDDLRVRRALAHSFNVSGLVRGPLRGVPAPVHGLYAPMSPYYVRPGTQYPYDPDQARSLLAEAEWTRTETGWERDGVALSLNLLAAEEKLERILAGTYLAERLKDAGVTSSCTTMPEGELLDRIMAGDFTASVFGIMFTPNPDQGIVWGSESLPPHGMNVFRLSDPEVDSLLARGRRTSRVDVQQEIYRDLQERLMQMVPAVPLYVHTVVFCVSDLVAMPFEPNAAGEMQYVARWYLKGGDTP